MCHSVLSLNGCHQHSILGFVNGTVLQLLALLQDFGIRDHQNASLEGWKDESDLIPRQGCMADIRVPPIQIAATVVPSVRLCCVVAQSDFNIFAPLKKHCGGHRCPAGTEIQEAVWQWFHLQHPEFYAESLYSLVTHCDKCLKLQGYCVEK